MPTGEKLEPSEKTAPESAPSFAELQKQKEELFKEIEGKSASFDEHDKYLIVSEILRYSVKDGFEMARKLAADLEAPLCSKEFNEHNAKFAVNFGIFLGNNKGWAGDENYRRIMNLINTCNSPDRYAINDSARQATPYKAEVEGYYQHFIRNRRVKSPEVPESGLTKTELTAEDHLLSAEAILKESYYTGPVRKLIGLSDGFSLDEFNSFGDSSAYDNLPDDPDRPKLTESEYWALHENYIDKETIDYIFWRYGVDLNSSEAQEVLRHARYAPSKLLFETRKKEAEKGLTESIRQSLIARGFKEGDFEVKFDEEKKEWSVVDRREKNSNKNKIEKDNELNLTEEISVRIDGITLDELGAGRTIVHKETTVVDGEAYSIFCDSDVYHDVILKENKIISDGGAEEKDIHKIGNDLVVFGHRLDDVGDAWRLIKGQKAAEFEEIGRYSAIHESGIQQIENLNYWVSVDNRLGPDETEKNISSGNFIIFRDSVILNKFKDLAQPPKLEVVDGLLCYVCEWKNDEKKLFWGEREFGPYDEIKLCENSKDKLVFYYKKGDRHFVCVDGVEKKLEYEYTPDASFFRSDLKLERLRAVNLVESEGGEIFIQFKNDINNELGNNIIYNIEENKGEKGYFRQNAYYADKFSNLQDINGEIAWLSYKHDDGWRFQMPGNGTIPIKIETGNNKVVSFGNNIFISDGKKILTVEINNNEFKEVTFDGPIELVKSADKLFIIESLADKKRIWEYTDKLELKLDEGEQRDLDLANAVAKEDLPTIEEYFRKYYPEETEKSVSERIKDELKNVAQQSRSFVGAVNQTIRDMPELFMNTFRAKNDKPTEFLMTQMFNYMFPEAGVRRDRALRDKKHSGENPWNIFGGGDSGEGSGSGGKSEKYDYDAGVDHLASVDQAGYYEMMNNPHEVIKLREPLSEREFVVGGIFGKYAGGAWGKVNVPISQEVADPGKETTFEFTDEKAGDIINLPKITNANIIADRIKGIDEHGREVPVEIIESNNLGEVRVKKGAHVERITYSQNYSEAPKTMAEITDHDYEKFRRDFEKSFGDQMTAEIGDVGDELDIFVRGLADKSPRERVIAIQEFCYEYGYYNVDNEVRDTNNFEERLSIMEHRMNELKAENPALEHKKYAGICTDFASFTTAMLRKAGFVSGIASGYLPESGNTSIMTNRAHAVSYVLWPNPENKDGKPDLIIVDGTPAGLTPRIVEQEKKAIEIHGELSVDAEQELAELEKVLKTMSPDDIKKLDNGVLEKTLNHILYGVKQSHVDVMDRVLNASRYAGFDILEMTRGNIEDQIEFRKFLEEEVMKEKGTSHDNRERRGEELFQLMLDFSERFKKDKNVHDKQEVFDVLEKVFDTAKRELDPVEERSAMAIITYLRARKMR